MALVEPGREPVLGPGPELEPEPEPVLGPERVLESEQDLLLPEPEREPVLGSVLGLEPEQALVPELERDQVTNQEIRQSVHPQPEQIQKSPRMKSQANQMPPYR